MLIALVSLIPETPVVPDFFRFSDPAAHEHTVPWRCTCEIDEGELAILGVRIIVLVHCGFDIHLCG